MAKQNKPPTVITFGKGPKIAPGQSIGPVGQTLNPPVYPGTPLDSSLWAKAGVWASVISSRCNAIMYEDVARGLGILYVTFKDGTTCSYDNFPQSMAEDMFNCTSLGAFITQRMKGWPYKII